MMRRFENLTYLFVGVAIGFLLIRLTYKKEVRTQYMVVEIPKTSDMSDCANENEQKYYQHLMK